MKAPRHPQERIGDSSSPSQPSRAKPFAGKIVPLQRAQGGPSTRKRKHADDPLLLPLTLSGSGRGRTAQRRRRNESGVRRTIMDKFNKTLASRQPVVLSIFRIIVSLLLFQYA